MSNNDSALSMLFMPALLANRYDHRCHRGARVLLLVFLLLWAGCAGEPSNHTVTHTTEDSVLYVENDGPGLQANRDAPPIAFELERTYGANEGAENPDMMLGRIASVAVDDNENVYVLDASSYQVKAFDAEGTLRWAVGREGEGPEELGGSYWNGALVWDGEDALYLSNQNGSRIDRIRTEDGAFTESYALAEYDVTFASLAGMHPSGDVLLKTSAWGHVGTNAHRLNPETGAISDHAQIRLRDTPHGEGRTAYTIMLTAHGDSLTGRFANETYELWMFDSEGSPSRVITRNLDTMIGNGIYEISNGGMRIRPYSGMQGPFVLPSGHMLAYRFEAPDVRDPDDHLRRMEEDGIDPPEYRASIDVFREDGAFVGATTWPNTREPDIGVPLHVDAAGALYTRTDDPYPQIRRYTVTINL